MKINLMAFIIHAFIVSKINFKTNTEFLKHHHKREREKQFEDFAFARRHGLDVICSFI